MRKTRRAAAFLEFVLLMPFLIAILLLTVDVGRTVLAIGALQDATAASARAAARVGYAGNVPTGTPCLTPATAQDVAYNAFCQSIGGLPAGDLTSFQVVEPATTTALGQTCIAGEPESEFVQIVATTDFSLLTPAVDRLAGGPGSQPGTVSLSATAVSRCEVAR